MKQSVKRKILTGGWTEFKFEHKAKRFFVKNYTSGDIYVSFVDDDSDDESFKITTGIGEEVAITYDILLGAENVVDKIYVKGSGEVEVQQLDMQ